MGSGGKGEATICTHLKTRRRAANEPQVVAIATNAKNGPSKLTTSAKGSPVMCTERETGEEKKTERWSRAAFKHTTYQGKFRFGMQMAPSRAEVKANSNN